MERISAPTRNEQRHSASEDSDAPPPELNVTWGREAAERKQEEMAEQERSRRKREADQAARMCDVLKRQAPTR
jgi:hypothetical protein